MIGSLCPGCGGRPEIDDDSYSCACGESGPAEDLLEQEEILEGTEVPMNDWKITKAEPYKPTYNWHEQTMAGYGHENLDPAGKAKMMTAHKDHVENALSHLDRGGAMYAFDDHSHYYEGDGKGNILYHLDMPYKNPDTIPLSRDEFASGHLAMLEDNRRAGADPSGAYKLYPSGDAMRAEHGTEEDWE